MTSVLDRPVGDALDPLADDEESADLGHGACGACGHDPACGHASVTSLGGTTWFCHTEDHSCFHGVATTRHDTYRREWENGTVDIVASFPVLIDAEGNEVTDVKIGLEPGVTPRVVKSTDKVWYCKVEGGEVVGNGDELEDGSAPANPDVPTDGPPCPSLRCVCAGCLASRAALRENAIHGAPAPKSGARGAWADRSWDGPLAQFPGHSHDDTKEH